MQLKINFALSHLHTTPQLAEEKPHSWTYQLVLEYCCWYTANTVNISVFNALSIGGGFVAAVLLCIERGAFVLTLTQQIFCLLVVWVDDSPCRR